jgi:Transcriptional regulator, AbiEi antitoxin/Protein of unknown function (DUF559)
MGRKVASPDLRVAAIAARQHGVATARQLRDAGLSEREVLERARKGRLFRLHQGVYAVGHPGVSQEGRWMAAVLACRSHRRAAFLSHRSAAASLGLLPAGEGPIEVVVRGSGGKAKRAGLLIHRSETLGADQVAQRHGVPVTTATRTIFDLRREPRRRRLSPAQLRRAMRQAAVLGYPLPGPAVDGTRSELETRFLALCKRHGLPRPALNVAVGPFTVDFLWRDRRLVVETDGFRFHRGRIAFEDDRRRDLQLLSYGLEVLRLTHDQVTRESRRVAEVLRARLSDPLGDIPTTPVGKSPNPS